MFYIRLWGHFWRDRQMRYAIIIFSILSFWTSNLLAETVLQCVYVEEPYYYCKKLGLGDKECRDVEKASKGIKKVPKAKAIIDKKSGVIKWYPRGDGEPLENYNKYKIINDSALVLAAATAEAIIRKDLKPEETKVLMHSWLLDKEKMLLGTISYGTYDHQRVSIFADFAATYRCSIPMK